MRTITDAFTNVCWC